MNNQEASFLQASVSISSSPVFPAHWLYYPDSKNFSNHIRSFSPMMSGPTFSLSDLYLLFWLPLSPNFESMIWPPLHIIFNYIVPLLSYLPVPERFVCVFRLYFLSSEFLPNPLQSSFHSHNCTWNHMFTNGFHLAKWVGNSLFSSCLSMSITWHNGALLLEEILHLTSKHYTLLFSSLATASSLLRWILIFLL